MSASKRGDLLALDLARLADAGAGLTSDRPVCHRRTAIRALRPISCRSTTAGRPLRISPRSSPRVAACKADITILKSDADLPWAGHSARYALPEIYEAIKAHSLSLMFVNTRSQAEMLFHELWRCNDDNLPIALHHGSLDVDQRRKVEAAMVAGKLRAVVCTSTLDLGIDWGDVDLVVNVGAPKGASRLAQRIGRANHRLDEPSKALLVPANRFEVMECQAALEAAEEGAAGHSANAPRRARRAGPAHSRHGLCGTFRLRLLYTEVTSACALSAVSPARASTRSSLSSRPAATRSRTTIATPN